MANTELEEAQATEPLPDEDPDQPFLGGFWAPDVIALLRDRGIAAKRIEFVMPTGDGPPTFIARDDSGAAAWQGCFVVSMRLTRANFVEATYTVSQLRPIAVSGEAELGEDEAEAGEQEPILGEITAWDIVNVLRAGGHDVTTVEFVSDDWDHATGFVARNGRGVATYEGGVLLVSDHEPDRILITFRVGEVRPL